ncbi:MAG: hypothetical protein AAGJ74_09445, partial [Pseudomonadota bacterium]
MKHHFATPLIAASLLFAAPAFSQSGTPVGSVDVSLEVDDIANPTAAQFWADLEKDLEEAILVRVSDRLDPGGSRIRIDIDEVALASGFQGALGEESVLAGDINVTHPTDKTKSQFYDLKIRAAQGGGQLGEGQQVAVI